MNRPSKIPNVWKMRVHTTDGTAGPGQTYPFLREHGLLGIGWKLKRIPADEEDAIKLAKEKYSEEKPRDSEKKPHGVGNIKRFIKEMQIGDLVWVRYKSLFALHQITGNWEYKSGKEWDDHDVHFVRKAKVVYETIDPPIGPVFSSLLGRQLTVSRFQEQKELVTAYSLWLCKSKKYNRGVCPQPSVVKLPNTKLLDLFTPEELEDAIGIYLQAKCGLVMIPSSRTRVDNTAGYEYMLMGTPNRPSDNACPSCQSPVFVQVKTQAKKAKKKNDKTKAEKETAFEVCTKESDECNWVLFSLKNYESLKKACKKAKVLDPNLIERFVWENKALMPTKIKHLMQLFNELKSPQ